MRRYWPVLFLLSCGTAESGDERDDLHERNGNRLRRQGLLVKHVVDEQFHRPRLEDA